MYIYIYIYITLDPALGRHDEKMRLRETIYVYHHYFKNKTTNFPFFRENKN